MKFKVLPFLLLFLALAITIPAQAQFRVSVGGIAPVPIVNAPVQPFVAAPVQPFVTAPVQPFVTAPVQPFVTAPVAPFGVAQPFSGRITSGFAPVPGPVFPGPATVGAVPVFSGQPVVSGTTVIFAGSFSAAPRRVIR